MEMAERAMMTAMKRARGRARVASGMGTATKRVMARAVKAMAMATRVVGD